MSPIAVDFSDARPPIAELQANDVVLVIRYLNGSGGKALSFAEFNSYLAAGIVVAFVFEVSADDATGGFAAGVAHAHTAAAALFVLKAIGCPVYYAVDQDIVPPMAVPYFLGVTSVMQPSQVGVYGEGALCTLLQSDGLATWFWQSESTSFPGNAATLSITHLQQKFNASPVPGTDLDLILKPDVGQWPRPAPPVVVPPPIQEEQMPFVAMVANTLEQFVVWSNGTKTGIPDPQSSAALLAAFDQKATVIFDTPGFLGSLKDA